MDLPKFQRLLPQRGGAEPQLHQADVFAKSPTAERAAILSHESSTTSAGSDLRQQIVLPTRMRYAFLNEGEERSQVNTEAPTVQPIQRIGSRPLSMISRIIDLRSDEL